MEEQDDVANLSRLSTVAKERAALRGGNAIGRLAVPKVAGALDTRAYGRPHGDRCRRVLIVQPEVRE
jgi:hypothetical protein